MLQPHRKHRDAGRSAEVQAASSSMNSTAVSATTKHDSSAATDQPCVRGRQCRRRSFTATAAAAAAHRCAVCGNGREWKRVRGDEKASTEEQPAAVPSIKKQNPPPLAPPFSAAASPATKPTSQARRRASAQLCLRSGAAAEAAQQVKTKQYEHSSTLSAAVFTQK